MMAVEKTTLAGGCFWCLEAAFEQLEGVLSVCPGYMGGPLPNPTYEAVCTGGTGHAEVIQIEFDPARIEFETLLSAFFALHDPTTLNRQGNDVGTQYRSAIFWHTPAQRDAAQAMVQRFNAAGIWPDPVVTEIVAASPFYAAEAYHHQYFRKNPYQGYCMAVVAPKAAKLRELFPSRIKPD